MDSFAIKSFSRAPGVRPGDIKGTTYVKGTQSGYGYEGVLMLVDCPEDDAPRVYSTFGRGHYNDARRAKKPVREAFCRLTGITQKEMNRAIREYKKAEAVKDRARNIDYLRARAKQCGINISIEE